VSSLSTLGSPDISPATILRRLRSSRQKWISDVACIRKSSPRRRSLARAAEMTGDGGGARAVEGATTKKKLSVWCSGKWTRIKRGVLWVLPHPGPQFLGARNFGKCNFFFMCNCEIYYAATLTAQQRQLGCVSQSALDKIVLTYLRDQITTSHVWRVAT